MEQYSISIDVGGTFTDSVLLSSQGRAWSDKVLTTHADPIQGILQGIHQLLGNAKVSPAQVRDLLVHATTLVTNVVIERKGLKTALLTTAGFEDILVIRNESRSNIFDNNQDFGEPLIPRAMTFGVQERILADGGVLQALDEAELAATLKALGDQKIVSVAVCLINAYANPAHERRIRAIAEVHLPGVAISLSSEVAPQIREYPRCSTVAINAYAMPIVAPYLGRLEQALAEAGFVQSPLVMLSSGGVIGAATAGRFPVRMIESGPAAGALAGSYLATITGRRRLLGFDIGGTTAKACFIENGSPLITNSFEVDRQYLFDEGTGLPILASCIDLIEIGTGGGSIADIDELELLTVGPKSAGSEPGPVCYARGGLLPTVTDADLVLGLLNADSFLGGAMPLDLSAATVALQTLGARLGLDAERTAVGVYQTVAEYMAAAIRSHAADRGMDWRGFSILAFGGAGPLHACYVAELLDAPEVVFPPLASVLSAFGTLVTPISIDLARGYISGLEAVDWDRAAALFAEMESDAAQILTQAGCDASDLRLSAGLDMRYRGQQHELTIDFPLEIIRACDIAGIRTAFEAAYSQKYALSLGNDIEVVAWRLKGRGKDRPIAKLSLADHAVKPKASNRRVTFPTGRCMTPVYARQELEMGRVYAGPALVEERDTTIVVLPGWSLHVDDLGCVVAARDPVDPETLKHRTFAVAT